MSSKNDIWINAWENATTIEEKKKIFIEFVDSDPPMKHPLLKILRKNKKDTKQVIEEVLYDENHKWLTDKTEAVTQVYIKNYKQAFK